VIALDGANFITWGTASRGVSDFSHYRVYQDAGSTSYLLGETDSEGFLDLLAANGDTYAYFVTAIDTDGHESDGSLSAEGTPRPDVAAVVQRVASTGYVRSKLTVFQGGAGKTGGAPATGLAGNTAIDVTRETETEVTVAEVATVSVTAAVDARLEQIRTARLKGYEGDSCTECGNFTLVRNGTCLKCDTCGATSGCS
jgi:hypothetical protein